MPLGERAGAVAATADPPPDNRAGWDVIADAYQREKFGERHAGQFMWSWTLSEDDVHLLDDVRGKRVLVLGCGGGQDVVALSERGAVAIGMDQSEKQIAYAREYASRRNAQNASVVEGNAEDLSRFDDESFDAVVSSHMLNYVEHIETALAEAARVLRPGGALSISVVHPFDTVLSDDAPYRAERSYWDVQHDWTWTFDSGEASPFRQWFWPVSRWFEMLTAAGLTVERIAELPETPLDGVARESERARLVPHTLMFKARKR